MGFFWEGMPCAICGQPLRSDDSIGFQYVGSRHPVVAALDDGSAHQACLDRWEHRDEFVRFWNEEVATTGFQFVTWFLRVDRRGHVRYCGHARGCLVWLLHLRRRRRLTRRCSGPPRRERAVE
jgi:hypothetical protein